ncbi:CNH domain-containing protein [Phellopilus nigrolimitatus]|nr:CNH domain-containing protein [Phellopilus nigrolimitatus]
MSDGLKTTATCRGFSAGASALMKACWSAEPRKRPNSDVLVREIISCLDLEARPELRKATHRPESSSSNSVMSTKSVSTSSSSQSSISHPLTPRSNESLRAGSQVTILATQADVSGSSGQIFSNSSQIFSEPASIGLDEDTERQESVEVLRKMSGLSIHSHKNVSEQTIHQESRLSFSSDGEEGHLGQRDNSAYERMPKLMSSLSLSKRRDSKDRFEILVSRMTVDGQVNPNWVGVASMEGLRGITRSSSKLTQVSAVESLVKREAQFLADTTDEYVTHRLRSDPGILGVDRLEGFLSNVFEGSHALRMCNHHFSNALQMYSNISTIGFTKMALLCKEAGEEFCLHYPEYVRCLPEIEACIMGEIESNGRFAGLMEEEMQHNGNTLRQVLENFLRAPVIHLDQHPRTLQLIISGMAVGDPEIPALQSSYEVMLKAVNLVHLSSWQQSADSKGWKDFVSTEIVKGASKMDVSRQTSIFTLIAEERNYVARLKILQEVLQNTHSELVNLQRKEDAALQDIVKSLIAVFSDFLRFHRRLLENLFTLQRSEHPFIGKFVTTCGVDRIPWHSLYDIRFGTSYRKLANMMQEDKVRSGIFKRIMQVISDIFPRLWDVSQQVELKTSISKERARLSSLAAALDFSDHPGVENDVDIASSSRILIMSGNLRLGMSNPRSRKFYLEERFVILLDNYSSLGITGILVLFTSKIDSQGILRLNVCERPVPLELITVSFNDIPPTNVPKFLRLCLKLHYSGQEIYLYAEKEHTPRVWQNKLQETLKTRAAESERTRVIDMELVHRFAKAPTCSAEFNLAGQDILVIACEAPTPGIWIRQGHNSGLRHVVALSGITSISVLDDLGILMSLLWYRLDDIMKGNRVTDRRLDESMSVYFYRTGCFGSRTFLVVSARKKGRNVLRFFEAAENGKSSKVMNTFKNKAGLFRLVTEVDLSYHVKDIYFLKSSFILVTDTFQLVNFSDAQHLKEDLTSTKRQVLPLPDDPLTDLAERCRSSIPIAINRFDKDFILCYQEYFKDFAAYINVNGQLSTKIVEWESKDVRNILFRPPYILILGTSTLEIRQIASGKLEQLMAAPSRIQLSWERRCDEDSQGNFGIHLILDASQDFGPSNQWYTLAADGHGDPYTLFRLSDRLWGR